MNIWTVIFEIGVETSWKCWEEQQMTWDCHKWASRTDPFKHPKKAQMPDDGAAILVDMFRVFFHRKALCGLKYPETKLFL